MDDDFSKIMSSFIRPPKQGTVPKKSKEEPEMTVKTETKPSADTVPDVSCKRTLSVERDVKLPITRQAKIEHHSKTVSCVEVDGGGGRLVTGSYDYNLGYFDFGGMDSKLEPFRYVNPDGAYKIRSAKFSKCSQWLLLATSSNTPVLMDRNGSKVRTYAEGDQYLRDLKNTNGHVAALTTCNWHPINPDQFLSSSADGTVRLWNIGYRKRQDYVLVVRGRNSAVRSAVTHARFNHDGSVIVSGSDDGTLKLFPGKGPWTFPSAQVSGHQPGSEITSLAIDRITGHKLVSRSTDDTVKLWDMRMIKDPLAVTTNLPNFVPETSVIFSPDDSLLVTGTSAKKGSEWGNLCFLDSSTLEPVHTVENLSQSSVVGLCWPASINQIITGNGDGSVSLLFDPDLSTKGALLCVDKTSRSQTTVTDVVADVSTRILTPHALPLFRDTTKSLARTRLKDRKDPIKSHLPTPPVEGPGQGGRLGTNLTQTIMAQNLPPPTSRDEDPREALLKFAAQAEANPMYVTPAYQQTQPKAVLDEELLKKEAEAERKKVLQSQNK